MTLQQERHLYNVHLLGSIADRVETSVHNIAANHPRLATIGNHASGFIPIYSDYKLVQDVKDSKKWVGIYLSVSAVKYAVPILGALILPVPLGEEFSLFSYSVLGIREGRSIDRMKKENQNLTESNLK